ncbi:hypothetical protein NEF87_004858 [Candidatus Lokiarchaeum ossiferum]|uniref:Uncharacterized protein n=1 Tax=Candidatus Lokiarchaeum ossiferum TaxID=2951803 RepID=A0ABY6HYV8_9ARCH|nr:hypothetical protein NEF87_004858 [Candidatus Lokiarchaeum sp. B-35]
MPKQNPKHSQKHLVRYARNKIIKKSKGTPKKREILAQTLKFSPKLPSSSKMAYAKRKYEYILFNLEHQIMAWADQYPLGNDYNVLNTLGCLLYSQKQWNANILQHSSDINSTTRLEPIELDLFENILKIIPELIQMSDCRGFSTLNLCLACIYDSASFWTVENGKTGYLDYIKQFVPTSLTENDLSEINTLFQENNSKSVFDENDN